ncbi:MAG: phosphomethylpyrimidine synthase ThiC [Candidatus Omnitrophica bacterium]|nr:phosphomethylpyrimidine synthase ThiC [Candidatus Omnitrophota bacterium]
MTIIEKVKKNTEVALIKNVAKTEGVAPCEIIRGIADGTIVIPKNRKRRIKKPCAIGKGLRTKINANIGTSLDIPSIDGELRKLKVSEKFGADTIMDLSTSKNLKNVRKEILENSNIPLGTVPIYEIAVLGAKKYGGVENIPESFFIDVIERQAKEGVDFFTIHAGVTQKTLQALKSSDRIMGIVSRGGAILMEWMLKNSKENPLYKQFDEIIGIAKEFDITLSLGDGMRPGAVIDATDEPQIEELLVLGALQKKAFRSGVQVIIEGPGHVPINQIKTNVELEKAICNGAPFYVLGPIVTDIAPGYDHITSAIGGALAASYGADFLCYVTPAEHLRLPSIEDVKEGVIASKIAAHAADIAKNAPGAIERDIEISKDRFWRNWEKQFNLAIDPEKCREYRKSSSPKIKDVCTMCSEYCSLKISERCLTSKGKLRRT